jgi:hypothetical protein
MGEQNTGQNDIPADQPIGEDLPERFKMTPAPGRSNIERDPRDLCAELEAAIGASSVDGVDVVRRLLPEALETIQYLLWRAYG